MATQWWYCDTCGGRVEAGSAMIEWPVDPGAVPNVRRGNSLRIVHAAGRGPGGNCQYDAHDPGTVVGDEALWVFLGGDGLRKLYSMISESKLPLRRREFAADTESVARRIIQAHANQPGAKDVIDVMRRLFEPGYEEERQRQRTVPASALNPRRVLDF